MSITVFPKTVKYYTVINDKLFEEDMASPALCCFAGENGTLEIRITLDYPWTDICPMVECENSKGDKDKGGVFYNGKVCYTVPKALMKAGILRFHLRSVVDGNIRKTADAEIKIEGSFECDPNEEVYEPTALEDLASTVANLNLKLEQNERNIEQLVNDIEDMDIKFNQEIFNRDIVSSALLNGAKVTNLDCAFESSQITGLPCLDFSKITSMQYTFRFCESLLEIPDMDLSSCTTMYECFRQCTALKKVGKLKTSNVKKMYSLFKSCLELETIEEIDLSSVDSMNLLFANCRKLKNVTFVGSINISIDLRNTALTEQSIMSCINALSEDGDGKVLFLGSLADKITNLQRKIATDKGWSIE